MKKSILTLFILVLLLILTSCVIPQGEVVTLPSLRGMSQAEIKTELDKLNVKIVNATKNLNIEYNVIKDDLKISLILLYAKLIVNAICVDTRPKISYNIVCGTSETAYLSVEPDIVWLSPDTLTEEFKINSNVVWKIY